MTEEQTIEITTNETSNEKSVAEYQAEVTRLTKELKKVRDEAAENRVNLREAREALGKAKSEDEYNALTQKLEAIEKAQAKADLVSKHATAVPEALRSEIAWPDDEAGIKAKAKSLAQFAVITGESNPSGGLGPRTTGGEESFDPAQLAAQIPR